MCIYMYRNMKVQKECVYSKCVGVYRMYALYELLSDWVFYIQLGECCV